MANIATVDPGEFPVERIGTVSKIEQTPDLVGRIAQSLAQLTPHGIIERG